MSLMKNFREITCWENSRRLEKLVEFREQANLYLKSLTSDSFGLYESKESKPIKTKINYLIQEVAGIVHAAEISTYVNHDRDQIEIISNIFMLRDLHISSEHVINFLERSIGVYQSDKRKSVLRTCNPFWWIGQLLDWLSHIPFRLIGSAGFNETRAEQSLVGRLFKVIFQLSHLQNSNSTSRAKLMAFDSWQFLALIRCWAACGASPR